MSVVMVIRPVDARALELLADAGGVREGDVVRFEAQAAAIAAARRLRDHARESWGLEGARLKAAVAGTVERAEALAGAAPDGTYLFADPPADLPPWTGQENVASLPPPAEDATRRLREAVGVEPEAPRHRRALWIVMALALGFVAGLAYTFL